MSINYLRNIKRNFVISFDYYDNLIYKNEKFE